MLIGLKIQSRSCVTVGEEKSFRFYYLNHLSSDRRVVQWVVLPPQARVLVWVEFHIWGSPGLCGLPLGSQVGSHNLASKWTGDCKLPLGVKYCANMCV